MTNRRKYLLGAAFGALTVGLIMIGAPKVVPRMKARMEAHCREMMTASTKPKIRNVKVNQFLGRVRGAVGN
jgi:hypothetical protein